MVKLLNKTISMLVKQQTNIIQAASVIMIAVALSRVLGLIRDRLLAARFTPHELGVYYAAFRLPNMIFELLVMGAMATAFIPVFTSYLDTKGKNAAFQMASSVINIGVLIFMIFSIPILIFTNQVSRILAPGFDDKQINLMSSFTQIMILAQVFPLIIGNFLTGILQSFRHFLIPSLAPIVYNLGIILGIVFLSPAAGLYAPVIGVVIGAILFTLIQIPLIYILGYRHKWYAKLSDPGTRSVGKLMIPRTLGLAVSQIDTTIDLMLSTLLGAGSVTVFNFAQHLQQLPVGLFGASIAQATLPALSSYYAKSSNSQFRKIFIDSFHQILFLTVPVSAILIVLRIPMVRLVFGATSLFDWESTVTTGKTLAYFSISLFAQSLIHLIARSYYAMHDSKTPVIIGGISVVINTSLSLFFILIAKFGVWSLGLSTSIAALFNMIMLLIYLNKKFGNFQTQDFFLPVVKIILAGIVAGIAIYLPIKLLDQLVFDTTRTINLIILTGISASAGISVYLFLAWFLDVPQIAIISKLIKRPKDPSEVSFDTSEEIVTKE